MTRTDTYKELKRRWLPVIVALHLVSLGAGLAALSSCTSEADVEHVVLYVSADDYVARQVLQVFEDKTGILVDMVGDTEATKTTGLANRLRNEADNPQADVFWSSECFMTIKLAEEGVLAPHQSYTVADWPEQYRDANGLWHGFGLRARVIVYAPDRIADEDIPRRWTDLKRAMYRDRIVMADPRFGTTGGHLGAMLTWWTQQFGEVGYTAFLQNLAANRVRLLTSGNAGVVQAVANGEADLGLTDTDDVWAAQRNGANVRLVYPAHGEPGEPRAGTLLIPNTVALIKGGPNPQQAAELIDFLLSDEVARLLAESDSHNIPVKDDIAGEFPDYAIPNRLDVDLAAVAANMDQAIEQAMTHLGGS